MKGERAMARKYDTSAYKKLLLHFMGEADPLYSMLQWLTERMMEVEAELKVGAAKGKTEPPKLELILKNTAQSSW